MGKQLLLDALQGKKTVRPPWLAFVGCHGGRLIGKTADEYLKSGELIVRGVREAIHQYRPDGISVMFDLQIEAEALGCELRWANEGPPAVVGHVLEHISLSALHAPDAQSGRIPEVLKAIRQLRDDHHDVALYGLITGPFTLALHLKGPDLFMDMFDKPAEVEALLRFCTDTAKQMAGLYIEAGCDVIASVDPMTSQISPRAFSQFVAPYATELFDEIRERQAYSSFFVCGHAQKNVEVMCQCRPDNVSVDENIPLDFVKEVSRRYGVSFGGNLQITVMLLMGAEDDVRQHVRETIELGGNTGYILAPGCDLPWGVPLANLHAIADVVHTTSERNHYRAESGEQSVLQRGVVVPEHVPGNQVVVDVITLDSEASAFSHYMLETVRDVVDYFGDAILWREHKIREHEVADFMLNIMVKNVPILCIDGEMTYIRAIPPQEELMKTIQKRIDVRRSLCEQRHS